MTCTATISPNCVECLQFFTEGGKIDVKVTKLYLGTKN